MSKATVQFIAAVLFLNVFGCDRFTKKKNDDKEEEAAPIALVGAEALVKSWSGIYQARIEDGKSLGDPRRVVVEFKQRSEKRDPEFTLTLIDESNAHASGSWEEFGGKSLQLKVKSSTISRIRVSDTVLLTDYDLTGNSLKVTAPDFELKVSYKAETQAEAEALNPGAGRWICEKNGIATRLSIANDYQWRGTMAQDGSRVVAFSGSGTISVLGPLELSILSASEPVPPGSRLVLWLEGEPVRLESVTGNRTDELGPCRNE